MKKSIPAALACTAAALLIPATASACPTGCGEGGGGAQLQIEDRPSVQIDTQAAQKEVDHAKSFKDAGAGLSQSDRDCFLGKILEGDYYDAGSHSIRNDSGARLSGNANLESYHASDLSLWLYEHEDTWWAGSQSWQVGDVLSFSQGQVSRTATASEFFSGVQVVAVYVGGGQVIYCPGAGAKVEQKSISSLEAELNLTVSVVSRPCDKGGAPDKETSTPPSQNTTSQNNGDKTRCDEKDGDDDETVCDDEGDDGDDHETECDEGDDGDDHESPCDEGDD